MASWTFTAEDLATGVARGPLPIESWAHTDRLNGPGEFTARFATDYDKIARDTINATLAGRTAIVARRDGVPVFTGIVWRPDYPDIAGAGLLSYFDAQTLDETKVYTGIDQHAMIVDLVDWVQTHGGNIQIDTSQVGLGGFVRDQIWYVWEQKNIGEAIRQKADIINGFDFDFRTEADGVRRLRLWTPRRGNLYLEQRSPTFAISGTRSNLLELPQAPRDATQAVTHVNALGQEIPATETVPNPNHERIIARAVREDLLTADPRWPRLVKPLDLPDIKTLDVLQEHADGWAAKYGGDATDEITLHVDPNHGTWSWGRWDLGDECWVAVPAGGSRWWPDGLSMVRRVVAHHWEVNGTSERLDIVTLGNIPIVTFAPPVVVEPPIIPPDPPPSPGPTSDGYMEFTGVTGNYVSDSADNAADPTGDITVIVDMAAADWTPGALQAIVGKYFSTTNQRSWELRLETTGKLSWQWSSNGTAVTPTLGGIATSTSTALASLANFARVRVAVAHDVVNGTSNVVRFSYSTDSGASWLPLGTVTGSDTATTYTTAIFNSTTPVAVGANNAGTLRPFAGRVYDVSVRTGISGTDTPGGTEVSGIRASSIPADNNTTGTPGQTFTSGGRTWNVNRSAATTSDTLLVPGGSTSGEPSQVLTGFFPIGVDGQPSDTVTINKWLARGVNTFVRVPTGTSIDAWSDEIELDGRVQQIRMPRQTPSDDIVSGAPVPTLLAWKHADKPDLISAQIGSETLQADYATWTAVTGHPPVFLLVTGRMDSHDAQTFNQADTSSYGAIWYGEYFEAADWIGEDRYPMNQDGAVSVAGVSLVGDSVDRLDDWSGSSGKPRFAYIECTDIKTDDVNPAPTAGQMRGEIWSAIIHGARGIVYFPSRLTPTFAEDTTPATLQAEMTTQNSSITGLQLVLQNPIDPAGFSATAPSPMEVGWRATSTHRYFICLNLSNSTRAGQPIGLAGAGGATSAEVYGENRNVPITSNQIVDTFGPYDRHIYKVAITPDVPNTGGTTINVSSTSAGAIAAAIASANPGDTVLIANGTYPPIVTAKVSSGVGVTIQGASRTGVIINGGIISTGGQYLNWTTFTVAGTIAGAANVKAGIYLTGSASHHQTFTNLNVHITSGSGADSTPQFAIRGGAHHITVDGCTVDAVNAQGGQSRCVLVYGDGGNTNEANYCHDLAFTNNTFTNADADNMFMYGMYQVRVEGNFFGPTEDNTDHNDHIQILRGWHDIYIIDNEFTGQCDQCIQVNGKNASLPLVAYNLYIQGNTTTLCSNNGLSLGGAQSGEVSGNDFSDVGNDPDPGEGTYGLVLWSGLPETGAQGAPAGSVMDQNRNMRIINNTFGTKTKAGSDLTANGVNGNVCTGNDIVI